MGKAKSVCLIFNLHQPVRLKRFRFFDIGNDPYYYDDYNNEVQWQRVAGTSVMPANALLLRQIMKRREKVKASFFISGVTLEQMSLYAPEVYGSFRFLADTGCIEFLGGTYSNSLASLASRDTFLDQALLHQKAMEELCGKSPEVFLNSELIYSDEIGAWTADAGFRATITEGARHILGWRSPDFLYFNAINPRMKILLRNFRLSDDLTFRFSNRDWSEFPLTAEKFLDWIVRLDRGDEVINICIDYLTFGIYQSKQSGFFEFMEKFIDLVAESDQIRFALPSEVITELQPVSLISVPQPVSWSEEERDLAIWTGNDLQTEALAKLYELAPLVANTKNRDLKRDWNYLQSADHFLYMSTDRSLRTLHLRPNPYHSPWDAFINFMNIVNDFKIRLDVKERGKMEER